MSPESKREGERHGDALNAMFHAAEAAVVWLADHHRIDTRRRHWAKANAAERLHAMGVTANDHKDLLSDLNQGRKDYWYDGEEFETEELETWLAEVEDLVADAERVE